MQLFRQISIALNYSFNPNLYLNCTQCGGKKSPKASVNNAGKNSPFAKPSLDAKQNVSPKNHLIIVQITFIPCCRVVLVWCAAAIADNESGICEDTAIVFRLPNLELKFHSRTNAQLLPSAVLLQIPCYLLAFCPPCCCMPCQY